MTQALANKPTTIAEPRRPKAPQNWFWLALEFAVVLVVALLCLEPILTIAGAADDQIQDLDPVTGWSPMVNRSFSWRKEWYCRSRFNSMGLRGDERGFAKPPNTLRVAVLGCSLTEALQVPYQNSYCNVLEQQLNSPSPGNKKVEVLDFGVSGYNIGQEYLRLTNYALKFNPDLAIIAIRPRFVPTQLQGIEMLGPPPDFGVTADGQLLLDRHRQKAWLKSPLGRLGAAASWLRYHSRLWGVVSICVEQFAAPAEDLSKLLQTIDGLASKFSKGHVALNSTPQKLDLVYGGRVVSALLKASNDACKNKGCRFMFVYLPDVRHKAIPGEEQVLQNCAAEASIDYLDLNPTFEQLDKQPHKPWLYVAHFNEEGHRIVGEQLATFVRRKHLLSADGLEAR